MARYDKEEYAKMMAKGADWLDAMQAAGYDVSNQESAKRQKRNLDKNKGLQNRISELKQLQEQKQASQATDAKPPKKLSPKEYLESVYNDLAQDPKMRMQAAVALLPYTENKMAQTGKKDDAQQTAQQLSTSGRFATASHQGDFFASVVTQ